jgi:hypothetical protein
MSEKKNIDRLFQEKFKDFEVAPPDFVWGNIQSRLEEKKKRRVIPLWFRLSGVAAILVTGMFVLAPYLTGGEDSNNNPVVIEVKDTNPDGTRGITPTEHPVRPGQPDHESAVASEGMNTNNTANTSAGGNEGAGSKKTSVPPTLKNNYGENTVASSNNTIKQTNKQQKNRKTGVPVNNAYPIESAVAQNERQNNSAGSNRNNFNTANRKQGSNINDKNNTPEGVNTNNRIQQTVAPVTNEQGVAVNSNERNNTTAPDNNATNSTGEEVRNKTVVQQEIKPDEGIAQSDIPPADSTAVETPENELEKLLRQKLKGEEDEELIADNSQGGKWNIKPQMAPLFFNTASSGSPIDADLAGNSKDFDNDLSYGVGLNYAITDRISIRSGINTVNMRYSTNDIEFYASLNDQPASAVATPEGQNASLIINPAGTTEMTNNFSSAPLTGSLVQKIGFVEVPLEMSYKLVNRKFGIDLIGGVSTLFLSDNNVSVVSDNGLSSNMGEASNINSVSFSTNVGVGFKYRIFDSLEASFEPMFKYQLNTFSNNSGNFKPYFIGLYSGISFNF